jgi:hypothetical protein
VKAIFKKLKPNCFEKGNAEVKIQKYGGTSWKVFFIVGSDRPCYCPGKGKIESFLSKTVGSIK